MQISIEHTKSPKQKPLDQTKLGFGVYTTDHMFIMNYDDGEGWHNPRIVPYAPVALDPTAMCLHYGQEVFEGMKAYLTEDKRILLFRPDRNMARLNSSNERLCIPQIDEKFAVEAIKELVKVDADWIPTAPDSSLYIRPFIFATDARLGVHPAHHLLFMVVLSPVGAYYPQGLNPVKIYVENNFVRAVRGGMGFVKTAGNYAASLKAQDEAEKKNYTQVLWLDGVERKYIEEVGTMNVFFKINGELITPSLDGATLPGVTRMSTIELLRSNGFTVTERKISIDEVADAAANGLLEEAFGTGTAAVISPIGELLYGENNMIINNGEIGVVSQMLYDELTGIQWGKKPDKFGWTVKII